MTAPHFAIETSGLGKRFAQRWALEDCSVSVPVGRLSALVGPNGAGKTTLLRLLVGLRAPSAGRAEVTGRAPAQRSEFLADVGFLAQDAPLYRRLSADEHLRALAGMNVRWEPDVARARLGTLSIPLDLPVAKLSGGQRAQVALALTLAKRPRVLLLDEPVAALDPLARREFLASLAEVVADGDLTVLLSSHLVHDLERICDHLILLARGHTQLCGDMDEILATHRLVTGHRCTDAELRRRFEVVRATHTERQTTAVVRTVGPRHDPDWQIQEIGLEEIVLAYMGAETELSAGPMSLVGRAS